MVNYVFKNVFYLMEPEGGSYCSHSGERWSAWFRRLAGAMERGEMGWIGMWEGEEMGFSLIYT